MRVTVARLSIDSVSRECEVLSAGNWEVALGWICEGRAVNQVVTPPRLKAWGGPSPELGPSHSSRAGDRLGPPRPGPEKRAPTPGGGGGVRVSGEAGWAGAAPGLWVSFPRSSQHRVLQRAE